MKTAKERVENFSMDKGHEVPQWAELLIEEHERDLVEAIAAYLAVKLDDNRASILIRSSAWRNPVAKPPAIGAAPLTIGGVYSFTGDAESGGTFTLAGGSLRVFRDRHYVFTASGAIDFLPGETVLQALERAVAEGRARRSDE